MRKRYTKTIAALLACLIVLPATQYAQDDGAAPAAEPEPAVEATVEVPATVAEPVADPVTEPDRADVAADTGNTTENGETEVLRLPGTPGEIPGATSTVGSTSNLISVTLNDVPLVDVVRMFTTISGANIIATSSNLQGMVNANLTDVEWRPALETILKEHNLTLRKTPEAEIYSIATIPPDAPEPMIVKTLFLDYTTVQDVSPVLRAMMAENAKISEFPQRNAVVVKSTAANLSEIEELLKDIDVEGKQVCIETKFMELSDQASKQLGIKWDSLEAFGVNLKAGPYSTKELIESTLSRDDSVGQWDNRNNNDTITEFYDMFDQQFEENSTTWEEVPPGSGNYSPVTVITPTRIITDTIDKGKNVQSDTVDSFSKTITEEQAAILEVDTLNIVLSALKRTDGVSIISNPKIIVANGSTNAYFSVGEREPIVRTEVTYGTEDSPGDREVAELDTSLSTDFISDGYLETGIQLKVIPVVKTDNLIEAAIYPSLRRKVGDKTVAANSWPIISVKEIRTKFTLQSGQTVAIGGLTDTSDSEKVSKIPVLGSIPLLGKYLFSHTEEIKSQMETIIFVTLSLAQPDTLFEETGIPEDSELVHKRLIESKAHQERFQSDLETIRTALDEELEKEVEEEGAE
jgi:type II secretory pathway component GspD/PulD (secretin)